MAGDGVFREALDAVAHGQRERARDLLTRLLRVDQSNPNYWLWMSSVVDSSKEKIYCLQNALRLDPDNRAARLGLVLQGSLPPAEDLSPSLPVRRKWVINEEGKSSGLIGSRLAFVGAGILLVSVLLVGFFGFRWRSGSFFAGKPLTITPMPWTATPTVTITPTKTPRLRIPTPTSASPTPLWMLLIATYTPTPLYVDTPHPISEAFRAGLLAYHSGDLEGMLNFMTQAAQLEPQAADVHYYIGEAYRLIGDLEKANAAYEQAITLDANFAPAYLGRAQVSFALDRTADIIGDLDLAIQLDPYLAEAYLERSAYYFQTGDHEVALEDLDLLEQLSPESPLLYLYRAYIYLAEGNDSAALQSAQLAYDMDQTLLPAYLVLGQSYLQSGEPVKARQYLHTYLQYETDNAQAWSMLGQAIFEQGDDYQAAIEAFDRALKYQADLFSALLFRGLTHLALEEGQLAVNDLFTARNLDRESFPASLGLGRALLIAGRLEEALSQISGSQVLSQDDRQLAEVHYWRAMTLEALGDKRAAVKEWQALLKLPKPAVPIEWIAFAQKHLASLTPEPSRSPTLTRATPVATKLTPSPHPSRTPSPTPSPSGTPPTVTP